MKKLLGLLIVALLLIPVLIWWQLFSDSPLTDPQASTTGDSLSFEQIKESVLQQHLDNTNKLSDHNSHQIILSELEINQLIDYWLENSSLSGLISATVTLLENTLVADLSIDTKLPIRPYLNVKLKVDSIDHQFQFRNASIGNLPLQQQDLLWIFNYFAERTDSAELNLLLESERLISAVRINDNSIALNYQPNNQLTKTLSRSQWLIALGTDVIGSIPVYQQRLYDINAAQDSSRPPLSLFLPPLFELASIRSEQGRNASSENKALLTALSLHIAPDYILDEVRKIDPQLIPSPSLRFSIARRQDLGQHFLLAAMITVMTNREVANQTGLLKELEDSQYTGFDVTDLIADRAGSLFAERLIQSDQSARAFQLRCQNIESESDFIPKLKPLAQTLENEIINPDNNPDKLYKMIGVLIDEALENRPLFRYQ